MSSLYGRSGMQGASGAPLRGGATGDIIPKGYNLGQLQQFTPEQMQLFRNMFGQVGPDSYLSRLAGGDEEIFKQIEAPLQRGFGQQLGQISSRFSGVDQGEISGRRGSGFQNTVTGAAQSFQESLGAQRQNLQSQAIIDLMGISESLLSQRPTERFLQKKPKSFLEELGIAFGGGVGEALPKLLMSLIGGG